MTKEHQIAMATQENSQDLRPGIMKFIINWHVSQFFHKENVSPYVRLTYDGNSSDSGGGGVGGGDDDGGNGDDGNDSDGGSGDGGGDGGGGGGRGGGGNGGESGD